MIQDHRDLALEQMAADLLLAQTAVALWRRMTLSALDQLAATLQTVDRQRVTIASFRAAAQHVRQEHGREADA